MEIQAKNLTHVEIEQTTPESVDYELIETLANLADMAGIDSTSYLKGTLNSDYAFKDSVGKVITRFPTLTINYTNRLLRLTENPEVKAWLIANYDNNSDGMSSVDELATIVNATLPDDVTSLEDTADDISNLLSLMTALKTIKGGSGLSGDIDITNNTLVTSVDMSDTETVNIDGVNDKTSLETLKYHKPTETIISDCGELDIENAENPTTLTMTCDEMDAIAHDICGTKLTINDSGEANPDASVHGINGITPTDGYYQDAVDDLAEKDITVDTTDKTEYQRILDPEVIKVLLNNMSLTAIDNGHVIKSGFSSLTTFNSWFKNNTSIKYVNDILKDNAITNLQSAFSGCASLTKIISGSNITMWNASEPFSGCTNLTLLVGLGVTRLGFNTGGWYNTNGTNVSTIFLPKLSFMGDLIIGRGTTVIDVGNKLEKVGSGQYTPVWYSNLKYLILRALSVPTFVGLGSVTNIFVPSDIIETYKVTDGWSSYTFYAIGGTDWCTAFGIEHLDEYDTDTYDELPNEVKYADVAMYAPDDYDEIVEAYENA